MFAKTGVHPKKNIDVPVPQNRQVRREESRENSNGDSFRRNLNALGREKDIVREKGAENLKEQWPLKNTFGNRKGTTLILDAEHLKGKHIATFW